MHKQPVLLFGFSILQYETSFWNFIQGRQDSLFVIECFDAVSGEYEICLSNPFQTSLAEQCPTYGHYVAEI